MSTELSNIPLLPRQDPITQLPILILYPHSRCNCRCLMCDIWRVKNRTELRAERLAGWLAEWNALGVKRVVLSGGEALLHSHLWDLCAMLREAGIRLTLLSTGLLLRKYADSIARYCEDVIVSLDGPEPVHDQIRNVPNAYARLREGVAALRATGVPLSISGRCTVQHANSPYLRATVQAARDLELDRISFLAADTHSAAFNRQPGWAPDPQHPIALTAEDIALLAEELGCLEKECADEFTTGFIAESQTKLRRRLLDYFTAVSGLGPFPINVCNAPWVSSVIESDGAVRPCFFQPALGNIHETGSLSAILNAPQARAFRRNLDTTTNPICRRCVCTLALPRIGQKAPVL